MPLRSVVRLGLLILLLLLLLFLLVCLLHFLLILLFTLRYSLLALLDLIEVVLHHEAVVLARLLCVQFAPRSNFSIIRSIAIGFHHDLLRLLPTLAHETRLDKNNKFAAIPR